MRSKTLDQLYFQKECWNYSQNAACFVEPVCCILYVQNAQNREMNFDM